MTVWCVYLQASLFRSQALLKAGIACAFGILNILSKVLYSLERLSQNGRVSTTIVHLGAAYPAAKLAGAGVQDSRGKAGAKSNTKVKKH